MFTEALTAPKDAGGGFFNPQSHKMQINTFFFFFFKLIFFFPLAPFGIRFGQTCVDPPLKSSVPIKTQWVLVLTFIYDFYL